MEETLGKTGKLDKMGPQVNQDNQGLDLPEIPGHWDLKDKMATPSPVPQLGRVQRDLSAGNLSFLAFLSH
jgi:hypothetical protein